MNIRQRRQRQVHGGYSITELMVACAIVGILVTSSAPFFLSYYQSSRLKVGAEEIAAFLNQGRQLAIRTNNNVCVHITGTAMHFHLGSCGGAAWVGPGTDADGNVPAPQGITLAATADPVFTYLGNASPAATYTVTNSDTGYSLHVAVAASGRISIGP